MHVCTHAVDSILGSGVFSQRGRESGKKGTLLDFFFWVGMQTQLFNKQRMIQMASAELQTCVIVLVIEAIG